MSYEEMKLTPHEKWGELPNNALKGRTSNPNNMAPKVSQRPTRKSNEK
jgi:hypothetical protein